jgi:hypothetical protein
VDDGFLPRGSAASISACANAHCDAACRTFMHCQMRNVRWVIVDLESRGLRVRLGTPIWARAVIGAGSSVDGLANMPVFRATHKSGSVAADDRYTRIGDAHEVRTPFLQTVTEVGVGALRANGWSHTKNATRCRLERITQSGEPVLQCRGTCQGENSRGAPVLLTSRSLTCSIAHAGMPTRGQ